MPKLSSKASAEHRRIAEEFKKKNGLTCEVVYATSAAEIDLEKAQLIIGIPDAEYRKLPGISQSSLNHFFTCEEKYHLLDVKKTFLAPTAPMRRGSAFDGLIFEGEEESDHFRALKKKSNGDESETAIRLNECEGELSRSPLFPRNMRGALESQVVMFVPMGDGIYLKGKSDYIFFKEKIVGDLKSTGNIKKFDQNGYDFQLGYYCFLIKLITGEQYGGRLLVVDTGKIQHHYFIEKTANYIERTFNQQRVFAAIARIAEAKKNGDWKAREREMIPSEDPCFNCPVYQFCQRSIQTQYYVQD